MNRKPPLAVSPRRLRPRRPPPSLPAIQTPMVKNKLKPPAKLTNRHSIECEPLFQKDCPIIFYDSIDLTKKVKEEFNTSNDPIICTNALFKRGKFYQLYSERRNEKLKKKMMEISEETVELYPEVSVEISKKMNLKKLKTPRKSCPGNFSVSRAKSSGLRSSCKELKKVSSLGVNRMDYVQVGKMIMTRSVRSKGI